MVNAYVLDSFALLAYVRREAGHATVRALIVEGIHSRINIAMSMVNLGETFYMLHKKDSPKKAAPLWRNISRLAINLYPADMSRTLAAAQLKVDYSRSKTQLSFADCYAAALAQELQATLLTGDPEFQTLTGIISIQFLPKS